MKYMFLDPRSMGRILLIFASLILCQHTRVYAAINYVQPNCVLTKDNYTQGSKYQQNLNTLLSNISSKAPITKFYNTTVGDVPNKVYGLFQCRADQSLEVCKGCVQDAARRIVQVCPFSSEAIVWYYECMLRYANRTIFSTFEWAPSVDKWSLINSSNHGDQFVQVLGDTMNSLIGDAVLTTSVGHFSTREANLSSFDTLYSLAECTPDLDEFGCSSCLKGALSEMSACCYGRLWAMVFLPSCQLRYDTRIFYNNTDQRLWTPSNIPISQNKRLKPSIIGGVAVAASVGLGLVVVCIWLFLRRTKTRHKSMLAEASKELHNVGGDETDNLGDNEFVQYDFSTLKASTEDFSGGNKLGEGGFGIVYKGTLENGQQIAIKRLSNNSKQGAKEFMTEARLVARLQHRNLVKLVGFCSEGEEKLLVYEFMANKSLDLFLFAPRNDQFLDWETRHRIVIGIARGIQYLHEDSRLTIIHRDLKTSNILLDKDMNPKIADFGIAKLFGGDQKLGNTSLIVGTYGYMAPEYVLTGEYSEKSDVFSFGVIVLEIVCGQKNIRFYQSPYKEGLAAYAWKLWNDRRSFELTDPKLYDNCSRSEVLRCIQIGVLCVQGNPVDRPTMAEVVLMLTGSAALPSPSAPVYPFQNINMPMADHSMADHSMADHSTTKSVSSHTEAEQDLYPR